MSLVTVTDRYPPNRRSARVGARGVSAASVDSAHGYGDGAGDQHETDHPEARRIIGVGVQDGGDTEHDDRACGCQTDNERRHRCVRGVDFGDAVMSNAAITAAPASQPYLRRW